MKFSTIITALIVICGFYALNGVWGLFERGGIWGMMHFDGERYIRGSIRIAYYGFLAMFFYKLNIMYKK